MKRDTTGPAYLSEEEYTAYIKTNPGAESLYKPLSVLCPHCTAMPGGGRTRLYYFLNPKGPQIALQCSGCQNSFIFRHPDTPSDVEPPKDAPPPQTGDPKKDPTPGIPKWPSPRAKVTPRSGDDV